LLYGIADKFFHGIQSSGMGRRAHLHGLCGAVTDLEVFRAAAAGWSTTTNR
jgi:hypothetical protein